MIRRNWSKPEIRVIEISLEDPAGAAKFHGISTLNLIQFEAEGYNIIVYTVELRHN